VGGARAKGGHMLANKYWQSEETCGETKINTATARTGKRINTGATHK